MMTEWQHALVKLAEECSEVQKRALKAMQYGMDEVQQGQRYSNAERLRAEMNDLLSAMWRIEEMKLVPRNHHKQMEIHHHQKTGKVECFLELSRKLGCVEPEPEPAPKEGVSDG